VKVAGRCGGGFGAHVFCGGEGLSGELEKPFPVGHGVAKGQEVREAFSNRGCGSAALVLMEFSEGVNLAGGIGDADGISARA